MKKKHHLYYLVQIAVVVFGISLVIYFSPNKNLQVLSVLLMSVFYAILGIIHHWINHDLVFKIVIEYLFIALLGFAVVLFLYRGGFGF